MEDVQNQKLQAMLNASKAVLAYDSFIESARVIFNEAKKAIGASSGYIALLTEDGSENEVLFLDAGGLPCSVDQNLPMPIRGLREEAYRNHKSVYMNDFMKGKYAKFMPPGHVILNNVLFAPLTISGATVGIMGLANKPTDFDDKDAEFASAFGDFAAIALNNSRNLDKLKATIENLENALNEVKRLQSMIPICAWCKKVRNDKGYWEMVEEYLSEKLDAQFTHSICPNCLDKVDKDLENQRKQN